MGSIGRDERIGKMSRTMTEHIIAGRRSVIYNRERAASSSLNLTYLLNDCKAKRIAKQEGLQSRKGEDTSNLFTAYKRIIILDSSSHFPLWFVSGMITVLI